MERLLQMGGMGQVIIDILIICGCSCLSLSLSQPPPGVDQPLMDTAETVYISSLALLKVLY